MGKETGIAWTKSTFNPWIGCTKIAPGCDGCYAHEVNLRWKDGANWGPGAPRARTSAKYWNEPIKWNRDAPASEFAGRKGFWPVFCASHADVFDNEVDPIWREDLWRLIRATPNLTWLLVTKRVGNIKKMLPPDWGTGYPNVWLLSTIVNQEEAERDLPKLRAIPAALHGVSYEPALGPINWRPHLDFLKWIIAGGESWQAHHAPRPYDTAWPRDTIKEGEAARCAVFHKQLGAKPLAGGQAIQLADDRAGADPDEWPEDLRVRQFPEVEVTA
jgi:protein gp37